jgi:hypothetical protein
MAQTARDTIERFTADLRQVFAATKDPVAQAQGVARHVRELLAKPGCLDDAVTPEAGARFGRVDLYRDADHGHPAPGFLVMCAVLPPSRQAGRGLTRGTPHDHGASWVVYGVYRGAIEQTKYRWVYPDGPGTAPTLQEGERFVQQVGDVAFFLPGEIHKTATVSDGPAVVLRVEGQSMDRVVRHRYDPQTHAAEMFQAAGR